MAGATQAPDVVVGVRAAQSERLDVVGHGGGADDATALADTAQRFTGQALLAEGDASAPLYASVPYSAR